MARQGIYRRYVPAVNPAPGTGGPGYWFAFSQGRLLLTSKDGKPDVPFVPNLEELGLHPLRTQYLGTLELKPCYSAEIAPEAGPPGGAILNDLRSTYGLVDEDVYLLAGRALQIVTWDQTHQYCGRCGGKTEDLAGERAKKCPACGHIAYPRLSPAVITAVVKGDEILLAHYAGRRGNMYTIIAGFVEPGETLEECLIREVYEEVGVRVKNPRYLASQPWPFPNSLMIGFTAEWESGEICVDGKELSEAAWFRVDSLPEIPPRWTIARDIIDWFVASRSSSTR